MRAFLTQSPWEQWYEHTCANWPLVLAVPSSVCKWYLCFPPSGLGPEQSFGSPTKLSLVVFRAGVQFPHRIRRVLPPTTPVSLRNMLPCIPGTFSARKNYSPAGTPLTVQRTRVSGRCLFLTGRHLHSHWYPNMSQPLLISVGMAATTANALVPCGYQHFVVFHCQVWQAFSWATLCSFSFLNYLCLRDSKAVLSTL